MNQTPRRNNLAVKIAEFRHSLSFIDALPQLTLLGCLVGLLTGVIIVAFRMAVELPLSLFLVEHSENFEALSIIARFACLAIGIMLLIALLQPLRGKDRELSVSHVLDRTHNHQAKLPLTNWCVQFAGAVICLASGQSVGREGPVVHLGAGAASQFGQWLKLPNNSIHTLVGCGVAAAISASFDTPMAGVIFAMEVLAMEYTIVGFVPVILASVMGAVVSKAAFGDSGFISVGDTNIASLYEIPVMVLIGAVLAVCAGIYIRLNIFALRFNDQPISRRLITAGLLTALAAIWVPEIMGQGYDTVNEALSGDTLFFGLALIGTTKLLLTPIVIGLGLPGGLIGPLLVIGACVGGAFGLLLAGWFPQLGANPGFYVMMGMAGMMAAALNAPLTALVTVLELSYNPNIIFPAMLVIVVACVSTRQLFGVKGIFVEQLHHSKRPLDFSPTQQALRRAGVRSVMDTNFAICEQSFDRHSAKSLLLKHPMWLLITDANGRYSGLMRAADLANFIAQSPTGESPEATFDLAEIPSRTYCAGAIHESASLYEAMQAFNDDTTEILYVSGKPTAYSGEVKGVITLAAIENYYKPAEFRNHAVD